jgi:hypothetical protein
LRQLRARQRDARGAERQIATLSSEQLDMMSMQGLLLLRGFKGILPILRWMILVGGVAVVHPHAVSAQSLDDVGGAVRVGDRWVYETRNEMTGFPQETYTEIVTETSPEEAIINLTFSGSDVSVLVTYDRGWNCIDNLIWKFTPDDGRGMKLPLSVGKTWEATFEARNTLSGMDLKGSSSSEVIARETITTSAGTFDTFKVEQHVRETDAAYPSTPKESQIVVWYAPDINHFVRRKILVKFAERTRGMRREELVEFTRKL